MPVDEPVPAGEGVPAGASPGRLRRLRHSVRGTLRLRLTLLYGGVFIAAGAGLLAITYGLFKHSQGAQNQTVSIRGVQFQLPARAKVSFYAARPGVVSALTSRPGGGGKAVTSRPGGGGKAVASGRWYEGCAGAGWRERCDAAPKFADRNRPREGSLPIVAAQADQAVGAAAAGRDRLARERPARERAGQRRLVAAGVVGDRAGRRGAAVDRACLVAGRARAAPAADDEHTCAGDQR